MLHDDWHVDTEVWAATSYQQLFRDGLEVDRWNRLHPTHEPRVPYVTTCLGTDPESIVVAASDYSKLLPASIKPWVPATLASLGTDGFGRSESRAALRDYFEVDARHVTWATLEALHRQGRFDAKKLARAKKKLDIDPDKPNPTDV
jgi:pyruvate dehydrogenase E1 component